MINFFFFFINGDVFFLFSIFYLLFMMFFELIISGYVFLVLVCVKYYINVFLFKV